MTATNQFSTSQINLSGLLPAEIVSCEQCLTRLAEHVQVINGVVNIEFNRCRGTATLEYDPATVSPATVESAIEQEGTTLESSYAHDEFPVEGMDCADCAATIERGVSRMNGVQWASINFAGGRMSVEYAPEQTNREDISKLVSSLGYRVGDDSTESVDTDDSESRLTWLLLSRENRQTAAGFIMTALAFTASQFGAPTWLPTALYVATILVAGLPIARKGIATLRATHRLDINLLMTIAVVGAGFIGEWFEAATVVVLFSLGETLESYTMDRARRSIKSLMSLAPTEAIVRGPDGEQRVPVATIAPGDIVIIRPGDRMPVDGVIVSGTSTVNQAPVTGESMPVEKEPESDVFSGTINGAGVLEVRATRPASDSTISRIIKMVEEAQAQKAPTQRFVDVFSMYYTPAVVVVAAFIALAPPLAFGADWSTWIYRALVLLVVACPCALVISTPVSIVSAISNAARNGVLIKGGAYLEAAGSLRALAFDKTGTLTLGKPKVTSVVPLNGMSETELLQLAATVEQYSEHPLGEAIVASAREQGLFLNGRRLEAVQAHTGRGIEALVDGITVRVGTRGLVLNGTQNVAIETQLEELERAGQTAVLVRSGDDVVGIIGLADELRTEARDAIHGLKAAGIKTTVMLTGDRQAVAESIAIATGVDAVKAELLPDQKVEAIEQLLQEHGRVGMVGDGVNDAPALARSTVGIAMGAAGSDTALETADIALMSDDLSKVAFTIRLSRSAKRVIAQNVIFSLAIKAVFLVLAIAGVATLWEAIIADVGASLLVTFNGMRLLRMRAD